MVLVEVNPFFLKIFKREIKNEKTKTLFCKTLVFLKTAKKK